MELQTIFIMLSVLLLLNLVEMQKNFVTWYDYCQESYIHRMEEFLTVLWHASLRPLGYNGRTIQRDLALILLACGIRKGCALLMVYGQPGKNEETIGIAFHMLDCFVATINLKYRPEYYQVVRISFAFTEPFVASNVGAAPLMITFLCINYIYWDSLNRMVFGEKATGFATRFQDSWLECTEKNPDTVTELAKLCKAITARLDMQREEARQMLPWYRKVQAYLDQRVGQWSLGKARQKITDLDLLMLHAGAINEPFLDLVSDLVFNGSSVNHRTRLEFVAGPVKQPMRTLQKLVRRYRRDVGRLTDLVRCIIIADSLEDVKNVLQLFPSISMVGLDTSFEENGKQIFTNVVFSGDQIFRITALENKFDPSYDANSSTLMGYRDLTLNVEVGWLISNGMVSFQRVRNWRLLNCLTHICEIQIRIRSIHTCVVQGHKEYVILRDGLSQ
jgi:hypothetical protein